MNYKKYISAFVVVSLIVAGIVIYPKNTRAAVALVQNKANSGINTTTVNISLSSPTTSGNCILVGVASYYNQAATGATYTVTDNKSNTYSLDFDYEGAVGSIWAFHSCGIVSSASPVITVTSNNGEYYIAEALEYSGLAASPYDVESGQTVNSTSVTSGSVTTNQASELLISYSNIVQTSPSITPTGGFTTIDTPSDGSFHSSQVQSQTVSSIGSYASTFTLASLPGNQTATLLVTYKAATSSAPAKKPQLIQFGVIDIKLT